MSKFSYCAPCFSGECGFCVNCCGGVDRSKESDIDRRSKSLKIMMGKEVVEEYRSVYNNRLNQWCRNRKYKDPYERGFAPNMMNMRGEKYILPNDIHQNICNDMYCRMLYHSDNEWDQKKKYPNYPIYSNKYNIDNSDKLSFCAICIERS
tara:strand:- start:209 stop:658 length:450 start_codon:yes stop_codon:yes gene_type:complete